MRLAAFTAEASSYKSKCYYSGGWGARARRQADAAVPQQDDSNGGSIVPLGPGFGWNCVQDGCPVPFLTAITECWLLSWNCELMHKCWKAALLLHAPWCSFRLDTCVDPCPPNASSGPPPTTPPYRCEGCPRGLQCCGDFDPITKQCCGSDVPLCATRCP